jgi:hypothetical protein
MFAKMARRSRAILVVSFALGMLLQAGCGTGPRRVPASGTVTIDGKPLEGGILYFNPDTSKGNNARVSCTSAVRDGRFELRTDGIERSDSGTGAPLGWYKVSLRVNMPGEKPVLPGPAIDVNPLYLDPKTTPLEIEVVENPEPGAYDLKLTK